MARIGMGIVALVAAGAAGCALFVDLDGLAPTNGDGGLPDAMPDAAMCASEGARQCGADEVLECQEGFLLRVEVCPFGCQDGECQPLTPLNLPDGSDFASATSELFVSEGSTAILNTETGAVTINGSPLPTVASRIQIQSGEGARAIRVFSFSSVIVQGTAELTGSNLAVLLAAGDIDVTGSIVFTDVDNQCPGGGTPGPAEGSCGPMDYGGGGGGGFASDGGKGGDDCTSCQFDTLGAPAGTAILGSVDIASFSPLSPGCKGSDGAPGPGAPGVPANAGAAGGAGGGLQLAALGTITIRSGGAVCATGAGGWSGASHTSCIGDPGMAGGGGGSGGTLVLEADAIVVESEALISTSGGSGAFGGMGGGTGQAANGCTLASPPVCGFRSGAFGDSAGDSGCPGQDSATDPGLPSGGGGGLGIVLFRSNDAADLQGQISGVKVEAALP